MAYSIGLQIEEASNKDILDYKVSWQCFAYVFIIIAIDLGTNFASRAIDANEDT